MILNNVLNSAIAHQGQRFHDLFMRYFLYSDSIYLLLARVEAARVEAVGAVLNHSVQFQDYLKRAQG